MLLVIDIGNTNTVVGLYDGDDIRAQWRVVTANYRTRDELRMLLTILMQQEGIECSTVQGCCISSVVPPLNSPMQDAIETAFSVTPIFVEPGIRTGLKLHTENPKELGADRLVNCVGALEDHEGPLIVIDFGTATTFDYVAADKEFKGGIIVPGIQLSANALFQHCAKLPRVDIAVPPHVIGRDTTTNIQSGLTYGYADLVDGLVRRMSEEVDSKPFVLATGGLATTIAGVANTIDVVDSELTMKGLKAIFHKNSRIPA